MKRRRWVLRTLAVGATIGATGCLGDDTDDSERIDANNDQPGNGAADNDEPSDENGVSDDGNGGDDETDTGEPVPSTLEAIANEFVELVDEGALEDAYEHVSPGFEAEISQGELAQFWALEVEPLGELRGIPSMDYRHTRADGAAVVIGRGEFEAGEMRFEFAFDGLAIIEFLVLPAGEWVVPDYVDQQAFSETELSLETTDECDLGATLTLPETAGQDQPIPGVVLVHGSGDQDRDQTAGPNRTFKELAWGLATNGVAVLRYDKRPFACDVDRTQATVDDIITDDAVTAIDRLQAEVDDVFVAGHSLGGRFTPRIATQAEDIAGAILLAPSGEPIADALLRQNEYLLTLDGELNDEDEKALDEIESLVEQIRNLDIADDELLEVADGRGKPFWEALQDYDHTGTAAELEIPQLILQGERDVLVTVDDDLAIWDDAIGDQPNVDIEIYDDLNHRFQSGDGPERPEEWSEAENPLDERVIDDLTEFIHQQTSG